VLRLLREVRIKGMAHITGGGLVENVPRMLPEGVQARLDRLAWRRPAIFDWLQRQGNVTDAEMHRVFNCGIGMAIVVARDDVARALSALGAAGERVTIGGRQRMLFMEQASADEVVAGISLGQAKRTLTDALRRLPALASDLENSRSGPARAMADRIARSGPPIWFLALDELESTGSELRHRLPGAQGAATGPRLGTAPNARAIPLSQLVGPMTLDPLTVADDDNFLDRVEAQTVLPEYVRGNLKEMY
jgi:hypothetical protein